MNTVKKVGKKMYLLVSASEYKTPVVLPTFTRSDARFLRVKDEIIVEVPLTPYQQKKINQMQGAV